MFGLPGAGLAIPSCRPGEIVVYVPPSALSVNQYSLEFSGGNGYALLGDLAGFDWDADEYTFSIWFKTTTLVSQQCLFSRAKSGTANIGIFAAINTDGTVYVYVGGVSTAGGDVSDFDWHQLTVTAGGGIAKLYLDGEQVGSNISIGTADHDGADLMVGNSRYNTNADDGFPFYGWAQGFTIFDRELSASEVEDHYNSGVPTDVESGTIGEDLAYHWPLGQGDTDIPTVYELGGADGTLINTAKVALTEVSPVHTPTALDVFDDSDPDADMLFDATNHPGTGTTSDWVDDIGGRHALFSAGSGSVTRAETSLFPGHYEITVNRLYRIAANAEFAFTANCEGTLLFRMYTGDLDFSGGFYMGYDGSLTFQSGFQVYNLYYSEDVGFRIRNPNNDGDNWAVEEHTSIHANKYVMCAVTWKVVSGVARLRAYAMGGMLGEDTTLDGTFTPPTSAPFGICGNAYTLTGGYSSNANGGKFLAVLRFNRELEPGEIALKCARFNALKGYLR